MAGRLASSIAVHAVGEAHCVIRVMRTGDSRTRRGLVALADARRPVDRRMAGGNGDYISPPDRITIYPVIKLLRNQRMGGVRGINTLTSCRRSSSFSVKHLKFRNTKILSPYGAIPLAAPLRYPCCVRLARSLWCLGS